VAHDDALHGPVEVMNDIAGKAGLAEHEVVFGEGVGIAVGGGGEHGESETGEFGRRDAVFIGHEFESDHAAVGSERIEDFSSEMAAGLDIEVVIEIGDEDDVVAFAEVGFEGAAGDDVVAVGDSESGCVAGGDGEDGRPIEGGDLGIGELLRGGDAEDAVACGDVEHFMDGVGVAGEDVSDFMGGRKHHGEHALGEFDPHGMFGFHGALFADGGAAEADGLGEAMEGLGEHGVGEEVSAGGDAGGRTVIEERGGNIGEGICFLRLIEEAEGDKEVAEDAEAAGRRVRAVGEGVGRVDAFADGCEEVEIDGGAEGGGALVAEEAIENDGGIKVRISHRVPV